MALNEFSILKIGKLTTPAAAVLGGSYLYAAGYSLFGILIVIAGFIVYLLVWHLTSATALKLAKEEKKKEKYRLNRERLRAERVQREAGMLPEKQRINKEMLVDKFAHNIAKKFLDSL